ncbi:MAG: uracil-DNA glycosylase [Bdellovibrionales bacterium]|nr:uracil-DNA glycosylase [Bdellovibrionales bacterium]
MKTPQESALLTLRTLYPELEHERFVATAQKRESTPSPDPAHCTRCALHIGRRCPVIARGSEAARVVFVGDFPSDEDDETGLPLSGAPGQLLDKMIAAMNLGPDDVFVTTLTKCRPPRTHTPSEEEILACGPHLEAQLQRLSRARWIVALGERAAQTLSASRASIHALRKEPFRFRGLRGFATYHPRSVLEDAGLKRPTWEDLKQVMAAMEDRS